VSTKSVAIQYGRLTKIDKLFKGGIDMANQDDDKNASNRGFSQ